MLEVYTKDAFIWIKCAFKTQQTFYSTKIQISYIKINYNTTWFHCGVWMLVHIYMLMGKSTKIGRKSTFVFCDVVLMYGKDKPSRWLGEANFIRCSISKSAREANPKCPRRPIPHQAALPPPSMLNNHVPIGWWHLDSPATWSGPKAPKPWMLLCNVTSCG